MSKYSEAFKLSAIQSYLSGMKSGRAVAQQYGVEHGMLRKWVAAYRVHGEASLKKKYGNYSAQFKLSVLKHMQEHALSHRETAAYFDIRNVGILGIWKRHYDAGGIQALSPRQQGRRKKMPPSPPTSPKSGNVQTRTREQVLEEELNYLRMENTYLKKLKALIQADQRAAQRRKHK